MKTGRPSNKVKDSYAERYGLTPCRRRKLELSFIDQLERCPSELARRILLKAIDTHPAKKGTHAERRTARLARLLA